MSLLMWRLLYKKTRTLIVACTIPAGTQPVDMKQLISHPTFSISCLGDVFPNSQPSPPKPVEHALRGRASPSLFLLSSPDHITEALGIDARSFGMAKVARESGVSQNALYRRLGKGGNLTLKTLLDVLAPFGVSLSASPKSHGENAVPHADTGFVWAKKCCRKKKEALEVRCEGGQVGFINPKEEISAWQN